MFAKNEETLKSLISRYQQKILAFALYLIGGDRDKAYEVAASSFAEAIRKGYSLEKGDVFFIRVISVVFGKSRDIKTMPNLDEIDSMDSSAEEKRSLHIVQTALVKLSFETKALLLLRDQLHLPYKDISAIVGISENNARVQIEEARFSLRKEIEEILNREG